MVPFALILGARIVPFALILGARIVPFALILGARIVPFALTLGARIVRLVCPCDSSQRNRHGSCGHRGEQHFLEHSLLLVLSMSSATAQRYRSLAASCALSDDSVYCSMFASLWPLPFLRLYQRVSPCRIGVRSTLGLGFDFAPGRYRRWVVGYRGGVCGAAGRPSAVDISWQGVTRPRPRSGGR